MRDLLKEWLINEDRYSEEELLTQLNTLEIDMREELSALELMTDEEICRLYCVDSRQEAIEAITEAYEDEVKYLKTRRFRE